MRRARWTTILCTVELFCGAGVFSAEACAQSPAAVRPYDGLTAGAETYRDAEAIRRQNIARQLNHVDLLKWYNGLPDRSDGVVLHRDPPSLDYWYAYGRGPTVWNGGTPQYGTGPATDVFEAWPRVPGDIFGYPDIPTARQPIGHISTQTGPNRWEYHPIYAEDLVVSRPSSSPASGIRRGGPATLPAAAAIPPPPQPARDNPPATGRQAF
jgi:hypothetical protein